MLHPKQRYPIIHSLFIEASCSPSDVYTTQSFPFATPRPDIIPFPPPEIIDVLQTSYDLAPLLVACGRYHSPSTIQSLVTRSANEIRPLPPKQHSPLLQTILSNTILSTYLQQERIKMEEQMRFEEHIKKGRAIYERMVTEPLASPPNEQPPTATSPLSSSISALHKLVKTVQIQQQQRKEHPPISLFSDNPQPIDTEELERKEKEMNEYGKKLISQKLNEIKAKNIAETEAAQPSETNDPNIGDASKDINTLRKLLKIRPQSRIKPESLRFKHILFTFTPPTETFPQAKPENVVLVDLGKQLAYRNPSEISSALHRRRRECDKQHRTHRSRSSGTARRRPDPEPPQIQIPPAAKRPQIDPSPDRSDSTQKKTRQKTIPAVKSETMMISVPDPLPLPQNGTQPFGFVYPKPRNPRNPQEQDKRSECMGSHLRDFDRIIPPNIRGKVSTTSRLVQEYLSTSRFKSIMGNAAETEKAHIPNEIPNSLVCLTEFGMMESHYNNRVSVQSQSSKLNSKVHECYHRFLPKK
ncbi:hypothetical protein BLNAU_13054 [Blattamonas nauphoetae]|uniref:Uncharacterized protein n=1 Tax=Blattamonas nauphoetae TaxID=2049346 RepID=A0ABQ9XMB9_9EUKA|nr:hypothetical protein BLNAU_13054 [Blattamonas nauphoetae]